ncbi:MAG: hypothetical protein WDN49_27675 [Acetobacteraceae bacterium]
MIPVRAAGCDDRRPLPRRPARAGADRGRRHRVHRAGHFGAHLRRMCTQYRGARDYLVAAVKTKLGAFLEVDAPDQGMHLTARLRPGLDDAAVARAGLKHGVVLRPMSPLYLAAPPVSALMLGFTGYDMPALQPGSTVWPPCLRAAARPRYPGWNSGRRLPQAGNVDGRGRADPARTLPASPHPGRSQPAPWR